MMGSFTARFSLAIGMVALLTSRVMAQGVAPASLQEKSVQRDLKLTEEQTKKVDGWTLTVQTQVLAGPALRSISAIGVTRWD